MSQESKLEPTKKQEIGNAPTPQGTLSFEGNAPQFPSMLPNQGPQVPPMYGAYVPFQYPGQSQPMGSESNNPQQTPQGIPMYPYPYPMQYPPQQQSQQKPGEAGQQPPQMQYFQMPMYPPVQSKDGKQPQQPQMYPMQGYYPPMQNYPGMQYSMPPQQMQQYPPQPVQEPMTQKATQQKLSANGNVLVCGGSKQIKVSQDPCASNYAPFITTQKRRFKIREKWFSFKDDSDILDEDGNKVFKVKGTFFSIGDKLKIYDLLGNEIAKITGEIFNLLPTWSIHQNGKKVAKLKKKFQIFNFGDSFSFDLLDTEGTDFTVKGDIIDHHFKIKRGEETVATISKQFFAVRDIYGVEIEPGENFVLILACCVCLDKFIDQERASHK